MLTRNYTFPVLVMLAVFSSAGRVAGQESRAGQPARTSSPTVTAASSNGFVRFSAPSNITQIRLEVFSSAGEKVFDSGLHDGSLFDWRWPDEKGLALAADNYLCVVTVQSLSGTTSRKIANISFDNKRANLKPVEIAQLNPVQAQAASVLETDASLTIIDGDQQIPATVMTHDGNDGQLIRTRGSVSFRFGDFFRGRDKEQMRLTEEGNLGIGTSKPGAKLDVMGAIRASEGFVFNDGSILNVNDKGGLSRTAADGSVTPNVAGTGSQNQIAKWVETGGAGTLGDSAVTEVGGQVGIGTPAPASLLHLAGPGGVSAITLNTPGSQRFRFQTVPGVPNWGALTLNANYNNGWVLDDPNTNGYFFKLDTRGGNAGGPNNGLWLFRIPSGPNPHSDETPIFGVTNGQAFFAGNVGIGGNPAGSKLDVSGNAVVRGSGTFANNIGVADFHIGYGLAAPFSTGSVARLAIQPYGHTGGPWRFVVRDDPNHAYLDLVYGNSPSGITLDHAGNVAIGTATTAEKLTVAGIVQSTSGGFKFPDGSVQTTAVSPVATSTTYTTYAATMGILNATPRPLLQLTSLPTDNYMVTLTLLARNLTAGNRTLSCSVTSDAQAPYHVDVANFAYTTLTIHGVSNVSSGSIVLNCSVEQGDGITVYDRRLTATKLNNVVVQ